MCEKLELSSKCRELLEACENGKQISFIANYDYLNDFALSLKSFLYLVTDLIFKRGCHDDDEDDEDIIDYCIDRQIELLRINANDFNEYVKSLKNTDE